MPRSKNLFDKRHLVLYGLGALALVVLFGIKLAGYPAKMSYTTEVSLPEASATPQGTGTTTESPTSVAQPETPQQRFTLEVVTDPQTQERGLSGRASIPENYGMLFVFPNKSLTGFWMKDMLTPIDMIWLANDGTILGIDDSIAPESYHEGRNPAVFYPPQPVRYVLETRAGEARRQGWRVGSHVPFTLP